MKRRLLKGQGLVDFDSMLCASAQDLDPLRVRAALRDHGCFVIREALPLSALDDIRAGAVQAYDAMESAHDRGELSPEEERRCRGYGILRPFEQSLSAASGSPMAEMIHVLVFESILGDVLRAVLGDDLLQLIEASHIRRQGPGQLGRPVPFHQDAGVMRMRTGGLLNFWAPLVDGAGDSAPGLELLPVALSEVVQCGRSDKPASVRDLMYSSFEIEDERISAYGNGTPLWAPVLNRGDVLCLDGWSIHRTAFRPSMQTMRYDFEIRFCRPDDYHADMVGEVRPIRIT